MHKAYTRLERIAGSVVAVEAPDATNRELAQVSWPGGTSLAQVIRLDGERAFLQVFAGGRGLPTDARVRFLGRPMRVPASDALLGRVFDGAGRPRDRGPEIEEEGVDIAGPSVNPAKRIIPRTMVRTGIPMIDVFNTLVESQKLPIFSVPGEPYHELLARIALQAEVDRIVLGGMGLKHDDYLYFRDTLEEAGALARTVAFIHTAADPTVECLLVPDMVLAVAERFALRGERVLVLLSDMTNFADALKEVAITMEQIPSNRGYPGDLYSQLAARYEKAVDFDDAGSITILAVTTMPGDDVTHPVPDNTGYITEGQFYLRGGRIEPFGSLSRLKQLVNGTTRDDHRALMNTMIQLYAAYRETLEKRAMGFRMSEWDEQLLRYGVGFEERLMDLEVDSAAGVRAGRRLGAAGRVLRARADRPGHGADRAPLAQAMSRVRASKSELKRQRDALARFQRYLPTLRLKQQQLQLELRRVEVAIHEVGEQETELLRVVGAWIDLWAEPQPLHAFVTLAEVHEGETSVAGVTLPTVEGFRWQRRTPPPDRTPPWVDEAVVMLERLTELRWRRQVLAEQRSRLADELRLTSQRVNLFEKVKIPEAEEALRIIRIALGDQQAAEVVRAKIAKAKSVERERTA
jgi:V/A-type H+/Na+-transporting ATPase subunit B